MWEIVDRLFLGDRDDARDRAMLSRRGITHVLNCAEEERCHFAEDLRYLHLRMRDPDERFAQLIPSACTFIDEGIAAGGVLVHCSAGVSRSAAVVVAWLTCRGGHDLTGAARFLSKRVLTNPDRLFLSQLARHLKVPLDDRGVGGLTEALMGHDPLGRRP